MFDSIKKLFKKKEKKKDGPSPEQIEKVRQNFLKEMERRRKVKLRRGTIGARGAFGNRTKSIPAGYAFTFPKVSDVRRQKREQKEKELAANVAV